MKAWDVPKHPKLLEQRAGGCESIGATRRSVDKTYWSSAQLVSYPQRNLLEQRAGRSKTYWSSAQVELNMLEQRAGRFCNCLISKIFSAFLHPYPLNLKHIQEDSSWVVYPNPAVNSVAYLLAADNVSGLLPIPLREVNQPVSITRNRFSRPRARLLACI
jgi:hypothetical protein